VEQLGNSGTSEGLIFVRSSHFVTIDFKLRHESKCMYVHPCSCTGVQSGAKHHSAGASLQMTAVDEYLLRAVEAYKKSLIFLTKDHTAVSEHVTTDFPEINALVI